MIRLGGPMFDAPSDPEELARAHVAFGYRAAFCPQVSLSDKERIRDIRRTLEEYVHPSFSTPLISHYH